MSGRSTRECGESVCRWDRHRGGALYACLPRPRRGVGQCAGTEHPSHEERLRSETWGRMGLNLTVLGAACAAIGVVCRGIAAHRLPWGNMYEFVTSALFFVVIAYLVLVAIHHVRWMGIAVTLLLAVGNGLAATVFYVAVAPLVPALHSVWFVIHIVAACIAAAALNVGAIASIMYLIATNAQAKAQRTGVPVKGLVAKLPPWNPWTLWHIAPTRSASRSGPSLSLLVRCGLTTPGDASGDGIPRRRGLW